MRLLNITASPHPFGNRIDLHWRLPANSPFTRVRVVRRTSSHPTTPNPADATEGIVLPEIPEQSFVIDREQVRGETVYYYSLFPYNTVKANGAIVISDPANQIDRRNRTQAAATSPFNSAGQMAELLPAIYHRYDTLLPKASAGLMGADRQQGQLRRFLALPGSQLDQMISQARRLLDCYDLDQVDGALLPLLAQLIGWSTNYGLELAAQRNEIRQALALYERIGTLPVVQSTVRRLTGWTSRTKEFVHNVALSNRAPRLNLWSRLLDVTNAQIPNKPLSLDFAYEGRPAAVRDSAGTLWLFYHTLMHGRWSIWSMTGVDSAAGGNAMEWSSSTPLSEPDGPAIHLKTPTAAVQGDQLWLFWERYDETSNRWRIDFRTQTGGVWSATAPFAISGADQRMPAAVADNTGGIWLFWLERAGLDGAWQLKYNRHDGTKWQLTPPATVPISAADGNQVQSDLFVLFTPAAPSLVVFWAWQKPAATLGGGQTRWGISYQVHSGVNPSQPQWKATQTLNAEGAADQHNREPAASVQADGKLALFWSSNRGGSWGIWRGVLDVATNVLSGSAVVIDDLYAQRTPLPLTRAAGGLLLLYRSNQSVVYDHPVYGPATSVDFRYAGATTVDIRNVAQKALRGRFEDFQTYTFDAGQSGQRTNQDWYARDTIGVFYQPGGDQSTLQEEKLARLGQVLREFMPLTERAVFIREQE